MQDLDTIIVLVLVAFYFIPQRSHHSLTLPRSRIRDSATAALMPGDDTTVIKVESSAKPISLFSNMEKRSDMYRRNNNGPKTLPCSPPDTTLNSLLQQPSTITCYERFDRNTVNIDRNLQYPQSRAYRECQMVDPIKGCTEVNLHNTSLLPTLQCTLQCKGHAEKCITGTQTFPISKLGGWKHTIPFRKSSPGAHEPTPGAQTP